METTSEKPQRIYHRLLNGIILLVREENVRNITPQEASELLDEDIETYGDIK